jgi:spermidine synthase
MLGKRPLIAMALCLGFVSTTTQVIILRELLVAFTGNELTLATTLATWLLSIAAGCFIFGRFARTRSLTAVGFLFIIAAPVVVFQAVLVRILDPLVGAFGEILSPAAVIGLSAACIAPGAVILGALFVGLVALAEDAEHARAIPLIYGYEAVGSAVAGALLSFYLLQSTTSFTGLAVGGTLSLACGSYLLLGRRPRVRREAWIVMVGGLAALLCVFATSGRLDLATRGIQWRPFHVVRSVETKYGNILVTGRDDTFDFFETGNLAYTVPDLMYAEESTHIPMLYQPRPQKVLVIGGAGSGIIGEVAKYRTVGVVDFVELDPEVIRLTNDYAPRGWLEGPAGTTVTPIYGDGRRYVATAGRTYDVVILSVGVPVTLQTARYYTTEFFRQVAGVLAPDGVLGLEVPSGGAYVSPELGSLLSSLENTCQGVFDHVTLVPGDYIHVVASPTLPLGSLTDSLPAVLAERGIQTSFLDRYHLFDRLSPLRRSDLDSVVAGYDTGAVSSDARPVSASYAIARWAKHFRSGRMLASMVQHATPFRFALGLLVSAIIVAPLLMRATRSPWSALPGSLSLYALGLTSMFTEVLVIIGFQVANGYVYGWIAALIASFMLGMGLASSLAASHRPVCTRFRLALLMLCLVALPPASLLVLGFAGSAGMATHAVLTDLPFAALAFAAGGLGGLVFAFGSAFLIDRGHRVIEAGTLAYSLDLCGATVAGFTTGFLAIPALGMRDSAYAVAAFNAVLLAVMLAWELTRPRARHTYI